jgi:hypothetical protein
MIGDEMNRSRPPEIAEHSPMAPDAQASASEDACPGDASAGESETYEIRPATEEELQRAVLWFNRHSVIEYKVRVGDHYETRYDTLAPVV